MTQLLISLADFADYTPFSRNIQASLVEPYIRDAQQFDVWPLLPAALRTELEGLRPWQASTEALFADSLRPLLVLEAAARMLLWHGTHVTPVGLEEQVQQATQLPASSKRRAELCADLQAKAATYRARLLAALPRPASCGPSVNRRPGRGGTSFAAL